MLQLTPHHNIHVAVAAVDFRKGIGGLVALCEQVLAYDPFGGHIFVFRNRLRTAVKLLVYDGNGFWLCHKRFSEGQLSWWPTSLDETVSLSAAQLQIVLQQGSPVEAQLPQPWHELKNVA